MYYSTSPEGRSADPAWCPRISELAMLTNTFQSLDLSAQKSYCQNTFVDICFLLLGKSSFSRTKKAPLATQSQKLNWKILKSIYHPTPNKFASSLRLKQPRPASTLSKRLSSSPRLSSRNIVSRYLPKRFVASLSHPI